MSFQDYQAEITHNPKILASIVLLLLGRISGFLPLAMPLSHLLLIMGFAVAIIFAGKTSKKKTISVSTRVQTNAALYYVVLLSTCLITVVLFQHKECITYALFIAIEFFLASLRFSTTREKITLLTILCVQSIVAVFCLHYVQPLPALLLSGFFITIFDFLFLYIGSWIIYKIYN